METTTFLSVRHLPNRSYITLVGAVPFLSYPTEIPAQSNRNSSGGSVPMRLTLFFNLLHATFSLPWPPSHIAFTYGNMPVLQLKTFQTSQTGELLTNTAQATAAGMTGHWACPYGRYGSLYNHKLSTFARNLADEEEEQFEEKVEDERQELGKKVQISSSENRLATQLAAWKALRKRLSTERWTKNFSTSQNFISIDEADQSTPDNWIPRSSNFIRMAGKHPLSKSAPAPNFVIRRGCPRYPGSVTPFADFKE